MLHDVRLPGKGRTIVFNALLAAGILLLWVKSIPVSQVATEALPRHRWPLVGLLLLMLLAMLARAVRWKLLLRPVTKVTLGDAFWINAAAGLANYVIPLRAGEALRLWWLARRQAVAVGAGLGVIVIDHLFDLGGLAALLGLTTALTIAGGATGLVRLAGLLVVLAGALALFVLIVGSAVFGTRLAASRLGRGLGENRQVRLLTHARSLRSGMAVICSGRRLLVLTLATITAVACDGLSFWMLFSMLGIRVPVLSAAAANAALLYTYLLPAAPGYVGTLEATGTAFLRTELGLPVATAAAVMLLWHVITAATILAFGLAALHRVRRRVPVPIAGQ